jgi:hypothetical protein
MKDLLLLLAHYPYDPSIKEIMAGLVKEIQDWDSFVKRVNDHGIIALAAYNIKEAGLENQVPEKSMAILENGLMQSIVRNAWLAERWKEVNEILNNAGIKHILLKGMALEHTIYGGRGLRQMTDNDILINREQAISAWEILQENGFEMMTPKSPLHLKIITRYGQHLPALFKDGYAVEIHSRLFDMTDDDNLHMKMFSESTEITVRGEKAYILSEDIHLKYLIKHHTRHALSGECQLRTYADIKMLDPGNNLEFPDEFVPEPSQSHKKSYRRAHYRSTVQSVPPGYRLRFIAGDVFPSVEWMKGRYRCATVKTIIYYPGRMGKLLWLI